MYSQIAASWKNKCDYKHDFWNQHPQLHGIWLFVRFGRVWNSECPVDIVHWEYKTDYTYELADCRAYTYLQIAAKWLDEDE